MLREAFVVRPFDPARDQGSLRDCIVEHQDFHRRLEPSWPDGASIARDYVAYLEGACAANDGGIFVADSEDQTVGFVCVSASMRTGSPDDPEPFAWIHDIFVKASHRGRGIATLLMAEAERHARSRGARVLRLGVLDRNDDAHRWYARLGFREYTHIVTKPLE